MLKFNNRTLTYNNRWLNEDEIIDPYNPLDLPSYTIRLLYENYVTPPFTKGTGVQVSQSPNIWDLTYANSDWSYLLESHHNLLEVIGANTKGVTNMEHMFKGCDRLITVALFNTSSVTNMSYMFSQCSSLLTTVPLFDTSNVTRMISMFSECWTLTTVPLFDTSKVAYMNYMFSYSSLTSVPLFDTSNVIDMYAMFLGCVALTSIPLFNTSKVINIGSMCNGCTRVESGALALYQQASTQVNPPTQHVQTFDGCGSATTTGAAELAQIPDDWK